MSGTGSRAVAVSAVYTTRSTAAARAVRVGVGDATHRVATIGART